MKTTRQEGGDDPDKTGDGEEGRDPSRHLLFTETTDEAWEDKPPRRSGSDGADWDFGGGKTQWDRAEVETARAFQTQGEAMSRGLLKPYWTRGCESRATMGSRRA